MAQEYRETPRDGGARKGNGPTGASASDTNTDHTRVGRTWGIRLLIAIALGVAFGAVVGVMGVRTLEPGNPGQADSLQLLLDSVANARAAERTAPTAPVATRTDTVVVADTVQAARVVAVPDLADIEEGDARVLLEELGFDVGQVVLRGSPKPMGTVLMSFPVAGERVTLPATINLVLSDGRGRRDSVDVHLLPLR